MLYFHHYPFQPYASKRAREGYVEQMMVGYHPESEGKKDDECRDHEAQEREAIG